MASSGGFSPYYVPLCALGGFLIGFTLFHAPFGMPDNHLVFVACTILGGTVGYLHSRAVLSRWIETRIPALAWRCGRAVRKLVQLWYPNL